MQTSKRNGKSKITLPQLPPEPVDLPGLSKPKRGRGAKPASDDTKGQIIFIPKIEVVTTEIEVVGISSLIVHAWSEKAKQEMRDTQQKAAKKPREKKDPVADFNGARYKDAKGRDCIPALAFKNAAVEAGVLCGVFKTTLRKAFFVRGELIPIICHDGPRMKESMVRVGMEKADLRYRPEYENWSAKVPVEFNPRVISIEQLVNLFDYAGYSIGICEWRPERNGQHGRFRVKIS